MDDFLKKITQYQVFNFLLPGVVFAAAVTEFTSIDLVTDNLLIGFFVYYFMGLIISRLGSIVIAPLLRKTKILKFAKYDDYLKAAEKDPKIDTLSQDNNTYRTLIAATLAFVTVYAVDKGLLELKTRVSGEVFIVVFSICLTALFVMAYKKQTDFIVRRVKRSSRT